MTEWQLLFELKHDEAEEARHGEVIEHGWAPGEEPFEDPTDEDDED